MEGNCEGGQNQQPVVAPDDDDDVYCTSIYATTF